MAAWEERVKTRIRNGARKYARLFAEMARAKKTEADIGNRVYDILEVVFGYDKDHVTAEYRVKGQFADYAVMVNGKVKFFVEVKGPNVKLNPNHLLQVITYAVKERCEWVVLTNGLEWQLYHINKAMPFEEEPVFSCALDDVGRGGALDGLFILSCEAMKRDLVRGYWNKKLAVRAPNLLRVLYGQPVIDKMRSELRALTGYRPTTEELRQLLENEIIRTDYVGHAKKASKVVPKKKAKTAVATDRSPSVPADQAAPAATAEVPSSE